MLDALGYKSKKAFISLTGVGEGGEGHERDVAPNLQSKQFYLCFLEASYHQWQSLSYS